jgi:hypothetical protein
MSDRFVEQRINIKFCTDLEKNASDNCAVLFEDYGGEAMKNSSVFEWYNRVKEGRENAEDDERSGSLRSDRTR